MSYRGVGNNLRLPALDSMEEQQFMAGGRILTINTGSSSAKAVPYRAPPTGGPLLTVPAE